MCMCSYKRGVATVRIYPYPAVQFNCNIGNARLQILIYQNFECIPFKINYATNLKSSVSDISHF